MQLTSIKEVFSEIPEKVQVSRRSWKDCNSTGPGYFRATWDRTTVEKGKQRIRLE